MRRATFVGLLVICSVVLGATVFSEPVAWAAQISNVFVTNDSSHAVPVHEQGTVAVQSAENQVAISGQIANDQAPFCNDSNLYTVPAGKQLVVEYVAATTAAGGLTTGAVGAFRTQQGSQPLPIVFEQQVAPHQFAGSEAVHYVYRSGRTIGFEGFLEGGNSCAIEWTLGGYLQPSP